MAQQKEAAPSGIAGLVRYEQEKSKVNIKPDYVFAGVAAITEVELLMQGLFLIAIAFGVLFGLMFYWMYKDRVAKVKTAAAKTVVQQPAAQSQPVQAHLQQNAAQQ